MVIECAHCQARFKLADDKLKNEGTKVRCSKCKEIFTVFPPGSGTATPPPAAAAAPPQTSVSADEIDFGEISFDSTPASQAETYSFDSPPPTSAANGAGVSFEMEDIARSATGAFSEPDAGATMFIPADGGTAATFAPPPAPESAFGDFNFDNAPAISPSTPTETSGFGEFDFGEAPPATGAQPLPSAETHDPFAFGETAGGDFNFGAPDSAPGAEPPSSGGGAKEDFDFSGMSFGDENATQVFQTPQTPAPRQPQAAQPQAAQPAAERQLNPAPSAGATRSPAERRLRPLPSAIPVPRAHSRNLGGLLLRAFSYLLVTALVAVAGAAIYYYQYPGRFDTRKLISEAINIINKSTATPAETGQIRLSSLSGSFITGAAGELFVIRGEATNEFKTPRSAIAVKGILFDKQGHLLRQQIAFCGNPFSDETLQTASFKKLDEAMANQFGDSLANLEVGAGKSLSFAIVFLAPPAELAEFTVELADAQGTTPPQ